jgi:hypothetical protein
MRGAGCWSNDTSRFAGKTPTAFIVALFMCSLRLAGETLDKIRR